MTGSAKSFFGDFTKGEKRRGVSLIDRGMIRLLKDGVGKHTPSYVGRNEASYYRGIRSILVLSRVAKNDFLLRLGALRILFYRSAEHAHVRSRVLGRKRVRDNMKRTLLCIHVMPYEFSMFERWIGDLRRALAFLEPSDQIVLRASLNLNPQLIDWSKSSLTPDYFVDRFQELTRGIPNLNEVRSDSSLCGTAQQKRESLSLECDQFIFADADIAFPAHFLKGELDASYQLSGRYMIFPQVVRLWDSTWDTLVHPEFISKQLGYHLTHPPQVTRAQPRAEITALKTDSLKFATGWFTVYSRELIDFVGIPESLGGYGAEDTFISFACKVARDNGFAVDSYTLQGVYVSEDYVSRDPTIGGAIDHRDMRQPQRHNAEQRLADELSKFALRALGKHLAFSIGQATK